MNKIETLSCLELPRVSLLLSGAEWCRQFAATIDHRRSFITRLGWATPHWASIGRAGESGAWLAAASARHHLGTSGARTVTAQCQQGEAGPRAAKALFSWVSDNDGSLGSSSQHQPAPNSQIRTLSTAALRPSAALSATSGKSCWNLQNMSTLVEDLHWQILCMIDIAVLLPWVWNVEREKVISRESLE